MPPPAGKPRIIKIKSGYEVIGDIVLNLSEEMDIPHIHLVTLINNPRQRTGFFMDNAA